MADYQNIVVVSGIYTKDGQEKKRYKTIGRLCQSARGPYITLDASVNLAAFPRKEGSDSVFASLYEPEGQRGYTQNAPSNGGEFDLPF